MKNKVSNKSSLRQGGFDGSAASGPVKNPDRSRLVIFNFALDWGRRFDKKTSGPAVGYRRQQAKPEGATSHNLTPMKLSRLPGWVLAGQAGNSAANAGKLARLPNDLGRSISLRRRSMKHYPSDPIPFRRTAGALRLLSAPALTMGLAINAM